MCSFHASSQLASMFSFVCVSTGCFFSLWALLLMSRDTMLQAWPALASATLLSARPMEGELGRLLPVTCLNIKLLIF